MNAVVVVVSVATASSPYEGKIGSTTAPHEKRRLLDGSPPKRATSSSSSSTLALH
jgi:hypothetical protein